MHNVPIVSYSSHALSKLSVSPHPPPFPSDYADCSPLNLGMGHPEHTRLLYVHVYTGCFLLVLCRMRCFQNAAVIKMPLRKKQYQKTGATWIRTDAYAIGGCW